MSASMTTKVNVIPDIVPNEKSITNSLMEGHAEYLQRLGPASYRYEHAFQAQRLKRRYESLNSNKSISRAKKPNCASYEDISVYASDNCDNAELTEYVKRRNNGIKEWSPDNLNHFSYLQDLARLTEAEKMTLGQPDTLETPDHPAVQFMYVEAQLAHMRSTRQAACGNLPRIYESPNSHKSLRMSALAASHNLFRPYPDPKNPVNDSYPEEAHFPTLNYVRINNVNNAAHPPLSMLVVAEVESSNILLLKDVCTMKFYTLAPAEGPKPQDLMEIASAKKVVLDDPGYEEFQPEREEYEPIPEDYESKYEEILISTSDGGIRIAGNVDMKIALQPAPSNVDSDSRFDSGMSVANSSCSSGPRTNTSTWSPPPTTDTQSGTPPPSTNVQSGTPRPSTDVQSGTPPPTTDRQSGTTPPNTDARYGIAPPTADAQSGTLYEIVGYPHGASKLRTFATGAFRIYRVNNYAQLYELYKFDHNTGVTR